MVMLAGDGMSVTLAIANALAEAKRLEDLARNVSAAADLVSPPLPIIEEVEPAVVAPAMNLSAHAASNDRTIELFARAHISSGLVSEDDSPLAIACLVMLSFLLCVVLIGQACGADWVRRCTAPRESADAPPKQPPDAPRPLASAERGRGQACLDHCGFSDRV